LVQTSPILEAGSAYSCRGWPKLPLLPLEILPASARTVQECFPDYELRRKDIIEILQSSAIDFDEVAVTHRFHQGSQPDRTTATLIVTCNEASQLWPGVICRIRAYLAEQGINIAIEFIVTSAVNNLFTFPVLSADKTIITLWETHLRRKVLDILKDSGKPWSTLDVWRRGTTEKSEECKPTVVVSAPAAAEDDEWWSIILPRIGSSCTTHLNVELIYSEPIYPRCLNSDADSPMSAARRLTVKDFDGNISMGTSCGLADSSGSGTIGGLIRLRMGDRDLGIFGLTNSHILSSPEFDDGQATKNLSVNFEAT
jgi:hypothetical protein